MTADGQTAFWSFTPDEALQLLDTGPEGLSSEESDHRLRIHGPNLLRGTKRSGNLGLLLSQFRSPLILILLAAAILSYFLHQTVDALIIVGIIMLSGALGFWQEKRAADAVEKLLAIVQVKTQAMRDGQPREIPLGEVVPGDVAVLKAGDVIPGDCLILKSKDLFVDEASLTGESFPAEKSAGVVSADEPLSRRTNALFMGAHVISGWATALVVLTGRTTELGKVSEKLRVRPLETEFERGVRRFGYLLTEVTLVLVVIVFGISVYLARPIIGSFLFALALAVGLIPELLPAIIGINLAVGATRMARERVIVKQLASIENFGSMNILCADKTGTLTEGDVQLKATLDARGEPSEKVRLYAFLNASYESGFSNPIDEAIRKDGRVDIAGYSKLDEVPYDFVRKRLTVLVSTNGKRLMTTKGAFFNVLDVCDWAESASGGIEEISQLREEIVGRYDRFGKEGLRTLGVAYRDVGSASVITKEQEAGMIFLGFLVFYDPPKQGIAEAIAELKYLGVSLRVISGDNRNVAAEVARQVGIVDPKVLTGSDLNRMSNEALRGRAGEIDVFAEVEPSQKERIVLALRRAGNVVGYLGDGINDASAMHAADVAISVNKAVDVAKEAAAIVLLEKDLSVLASGVREGRTTFANTLKYVFMTTSANFGNMFSMAGAALFLPFLPLLPKQILLNNFLTDFPAMAIASDSVDRDLIDRPRRWDIKFIRDFMITFGIISSVFDFLTFGVLLWVLHADQDQFRTGWFLESVITEVVIVGVIRTGKPFYTSRPGNALIAASLFILAVSIVLPYVPLNRYLSFTPMPGSFIVALAAVTILYVAASEVAKRFFYDRYQLSGYKREPSG